MHGVQLLINSVKGKGQRESASPRILCQSRQSYGAMEGFLAEEQARPNGVPSLQHQVCRNGPGGSSLAPGCGNKKAAAHRRRENGLFRNTLSTLFWNLGRLKKCNDCRLLQHTFSAF
ncbi:unnamed protein product [Boreogadus saida]